MASKVVVDGVVMDVGGVVEAGGMAEDAVDVMVGVVEGNVILHRKSCVFGKGWEERETERDRGRIFNGHRYHPPFAISLVRLFNKRPIHAKRNAC
jgi:hypothetical protein